MIEIFIYLIISVLAACGMAIALVEKGDDYPIRKPRLLLKSFIHDKISIKFSQVLDCSVCTSFWTSLFIDITLCVISGGTYFLWPLSGFITVGLVWFIIEFLNAIDKEC